MPAGRSEMAGLLMVVIRAVRRAPWAGANRPGDRAWDARPRRFGRERGLIQAKRAAGCNSSGQTKTPGRQGCHCPSSRWRCALLELTDDGTTRFRKGAVSLGIEGRFARVISKQARRHSESPRRRRETAPRANRHGRLAKMRPKAVLMLYGNDELRHSCPGRHRCPKREVY